MKVSLFRLPHCRLQRLNLPNYYRKLRTLHTPTSQRQTIYALSTPPGKAGVAIARISGPDALRAWKDIVRPMKESLKRPEAWKMHRARIVHPQNGSLIDEGIAVFFNAPYTYTTQPILELHIHSGRALINSLLASISALPYTRPAEPGEFTRQAFMGGRLDLTQVEGLHDLIEAETDMQRVWALESAGGRTKKLYTSFRTEIIQALAQIEALIDFGEDEDIEEGVFEVAKATSSRLLDNLRIHLADSGRGEIVREGIKMTIFGPPNAGKSSLFNFLANRPISIVTPIAGTTRDVLHSTLDIGGLPVVLADTAGLRKTEDVVEKVGVKKAESEVRTADFSICVLPLPEVLTTSTSHSTLGDALDITVPAEISRLITPTTYFLLNKIDLVPSFTYHTHHDRTVRIRLWCNGENVAHTNDYHRRVWFTSLAGDEEASLQDSDLKHRLHAPHLSTSVDSMRGRQEFVEGLGNALRRQLGIESKNDGDVNPSSQMQTVIDRVHAPIITRARHRVHLEEACKFLDAFLAMPPSEIVLAAEELRYAAQALGRVTGEIGVEDVLDVVFRDFCIGK